MNRNTRNTRRTGSMRPVGGPPSARQSQMPVGLVIGGCVVAAFILFGVVAANRSEPTKSPPNQDKGTSTAPTASQKPQAQPPAPLKAAPISVIEAEGSLLHVNTVHVSLPFSAEDWARYFGRPNRQTGPFTNGRTRAIWDDEGIDVLVEDGNVIEVHVYLYHQSESNEQPHGTFKGSIKVNRNTVTQDTPAIGLKLDLTVNNPMERAFCYSKNYSNHNISVWQLARGIEHVSIGLAEH